MRMYYVDCVERGGVSVEVLDLYTLSRKYIMGSPIHSFIHALRQPSLLLLVTTIVLNVYVTFNFCWYSREST